MTEKTKHIGLRCTEEMLYKLKFIAEYEGRSINGEILHLINCEIRKFEKENGTIDEVETQN